MSNRFSKSFFRELLLSSGLFIGILASVTGNAESDSFRHQQLPFCRPEAGGSFLTTILNPDKSIASRGLITLSRDGNFFLGDSNQGGVEGIFNAFTTSQGVWRCSGRYTLSATAINFSLPGTATNQGGIARVDYKATFKSKNIITGTVQLRFFNLDSDPLNTDIPPASTLIFTGQRIIAR